MTSSVPEKKAPILTFEGNKYSLGDLPKETQDLIKDEPQINTPLLEISENLEIEESGKWNCFHRSSEEK